MDSSNLSIESNLEQKVELGREKYPSEEPLLQSGGTTNENGINNAEVYNGMRQRFAKSGGGGSRGATGSGFEVIKLKHSKSTSSNRGIAAERLQSQFEALKDLKKKQKLAQQQNSGNQSQSPKEAITAKEVSPLGSPDIPGPSISFDLQNAIKRSQLIEFLSPFGFILLNMIFNLSFYLNYQCDTQENGWRSYISYSLKAGGCAFHLTLTIVCLAIITYYTRLKFMKQQEKLRNSLIQVIAVGISVLFWIVPLGTLFLFSDAYQRGALSLNDPNLEIPLRPSHVAMAIFSISFSVSTYKLLWRSTRKVLCLIQVLMPLIGIPLSLGTLILHSQAKSTLYFDYPVIVICSGLASFLNLSSSETNCLLHLSFEEKELELTKQNHRLSIQIGEEKRYQESMKKYMAYLFHEVRTPLNSVVFGVDNLKELLNEMQATSHNQTRMANSVLQDLTTDFSSMNNLNTSGTSISMQPPSPPTSSVSEGSNVSSNTPGEDIMIQHVWDKLEGKGSQPHRKKGRGSAVRARSSPPPAPANTLSRVNLLSISRSVSGVSKIFTSEQPQNVSHELSSPALASTPLITVAGDSLSNNSQEHAAKFKSPLKLLVSSNLSSFDSWDILWETLEGLELSSNRAKVILNRVLDLNSMENGLLKVTKKPFELVGSVKDVISMLKPMSSNKNIKITLELSGNCFKRANFPLSPLSPKVTSLNQSPSTYPGSPSTSNRNKAPNASKSPISPAPSPKIISKTPSATTKPLHDSGSAEMAASASLKHSMTYGFSEGALNKSCNSKLMIHWDCSRYQELVSNLLSNALKYTPVNGKVKVRIEANYLDDALIEKESPTSPQFIDNMGFLSPGSKSSKAASATPGSFSSSLSSAPSSNPTIVSLTASTAPEYYRRCVIKSSIIDDGPGIKKEDVEKLFTPFSDISEHQGQQYHGSTQKKISSSGLGLAICKKIVEMSNGTIDVISSPGHGSTFSFQLNLNSIVSISGSASVCSNAATATTRTSLVNSHGIEATHDETVSDSVISLHERENIKVEREEERAVDLTSVDALEGKDRVDEMEFATTSNVVEEHAEINEEAGEEETETRRFNSLYNFHLSDALRDASIVNLINGSNSPRGRSKLAQHQENYNSASSVKIINQATTSTNSSLALSDVINHNSDNTLYSKVSLPSSDDGNGGNGNPNNSLSRAAMVSTSSSHNNIGSMAIRTLGSNSLVEQKENKKGKPTSPFINRRNMGVANNVAGSSPSVIISKSILANVSLLIVDDDTINVRLMTLSMTRCGCTCYSASNGYQALELLSHHHFDVVLLDRNMPVMDGPETLRVIKNGNFINGRVVEVVVPTGEEDGKERDSSDEEVNLNALIMENQEKWSRIRIIAVTGSTEDEQQEFLDLGADKVMVKPVRPDDLRNSILGLLQTLELTVQGEDEEEEEVVAVKE